MIEINDAYMSTHTLKSYKKKLKRGKGRQKNTKVSVMAESFPLEDENGNRSNFCGNFKMKVNPEEYKESMNYISQNHIHHESIFFQTKTPILKPIYKLYSLKLIGIWILIDKYSDYQ
jgi:hypothetical protein